LEYRRSTASRETTEIPVSAASSQWIFRVSSSRIRGSVASPIPRKARVGRESASEGGKPRPRMQTRRIFRMGFLHRVIDTAHHAILPVRKPVIFAAANGGGIQVLRPNLRWISSRENRTTMGAPEGDT